MLKTFDKYALIIDDDREVLSDVAKLIESCGVGSVLASSVAEARLRMRIKKFDLIITDLVMPKENGIQFLVSLYQNKDYGLQKEIPALAVLTAFALNDVLQNKLTNGLKVELILSKPLNEKLLKDYLIKKYATKVKENAYDVNTINKFLIATIETIAGNTKIKPEPNKAFVRSDGQALGEFTGIIEITSKNRKGIIALSFERNCCTEMAKKILYDDKLDMTDVILRDVSGEMCNQVAGNAQAQFNKEGIIFTISTPTIVSGLKYRIDHKIQTVCVVIPFLWNNYKFYTQFIMVVANSDEATKYVELKAKENLNKKDNVIL